ncbi:MAG TPA: DUF1800 family protein, partial [Stellaceae bacterium]|nr:DUF1800 family protein [Stellaceae bacterium]
MKLGLLLSAALALAGSTGLLDGAAAGTLSPQEHAEHLARRFAFSMPPAAVAGLAAPGADIAWLDQQLQPGTIDDAGSTLESPPQQLNPDGGFPDWNIYERIMLQHWVRTHRQVQAKLELHWLDHFSVSLDKVGDPAVMANYDKLVRQNALGNFTDLATAVATSAAMLEWLDNDGNIGPVANENFARECMQLFVMGPYQLRMNGAVKTDANGLPIPNYSQDDVQAVALAMTGYQVIYSWNDLNPQTRFTVVYLPGNHDPRPLRFQGQTYTVPDSMKAMRHVISILTHNPSTAPFQAKEMLQRFVTETPSPEYVAAIASVWAQHVDDPDQIAQVVKAIVEYPEFDQADHAMLKQPIELMVGMLRQLPGLLQPSSGNGPGESLIWALSDASQEPYTPPSVFSFYRPGQLATMVNASSRLNRGNDLAWLASIKPGDSYAMTMFDIAKLRTRIGSTKARPIADYLLQALLGGDNPTLRSILV